MEICLKERLENEERGTFWLKYSGSELNVVIY